jgi:hypothetical protein
MVGVDSRSWIVSRDNLWRFELMLMFSDVVGIGSCHFRGSLSKSLDKEVKAELVGVKKKAENVLHSINTTNKLQRNPIVIPIPNSPSCTSYLLPLGPDSVPSTSPFGDCIPQPPPNASLSVTTQPRLVSRAHVDDDSVQIDY